MPSIYVASPSDYNAGLHGRWVDSDQDAEASGAEVPLMRAEAPEPGAEEWAIHDYDGFGGLHLGEWGALRPGLFLGAACQHDADAIAGYLDTLGADADLDGFVESYHGRHDSLLAFVEQWAEDIGYSGCPAPRGPRRAHRRVLGLRNTGTRP